MKKKYNILIFQPYPKFGGADRSIIRLINGINEADFTLISLTKCNYKKYLNKKINLVELSSSRTFFSILELRKKVEHLTQNSKIKKNIFISNQNFANVVSILSLNNILNLKIILIERNHLNELKNFTNLIDLIKKRLILILIKLTYRKADKIVGISKTLSTDLSKHINKKVSTIYNPALDDSLYKKKIDKINLVKDIQKKKIILNVGFFENQKNQITILKAFNLLRFEFKDIHLILIGRGSKEKQIKKYIDKNDLNNSVSILKNINNPKNYYKIAKVFVLSSKYEGFGNVLVEALKNNCPVITSDCKSYSMEIISNGKYGDYFKTGDYKELKLKIRNYLLDNRYLLNKMKKAKLHLKKFGIQNNKNEFKKLFEKI